MIVVVASRGRARTCNTSFKIYIYFLQTGVSAGSSVFQWVTLGRQVTAPAEAAQAGTSALGYPRVADTTTKFRA